MTNKYNVYLDAKVQFVCQLNHSDSLHVLTPLYFVLLRLHSSLHGTACLFTLSDGLFSFSPSILQWYREIGGSVQWWRSSWYPCGAFQWTRPQVTTTKLHYYISKRTKSKIKSIVFSLGNATTEHKPCSWSPQLKTKTYLNKKICVCLAQMFFNQILMHLKFNFILYFG